MQRRAKINVAEFPKCPAGESLIVRSDSGTPDSETVLTVDLLFLLFLNLKHLLSTLRHGHVPWRLVDLPSPGHILKRLFFHLDVQEDEGMKSDRGVLPDTVVETSRFPSLGEENHRNSLAEVVELETCCAYRVEDGSIGDGFGRNREFTGTQDKVRMRGGTVLSVNPGFRLRVL